MSQFANQSVPILRFTDFKKPWPVKKLSEVLLSIIGGGTPDRSEAKYYKEGAIPWATVKNLADDNYKIETKENITQEGVDNSSAKISPKDSFIISTRMGVGRGFVNLVPMAINQDLKAILVNKGSSDDSLFNDLVQK